jgi:ABC-type lipoprotein export system ATPase subunit
MPGRMIAVRNLEHRYQGNRALSLPQWQAAAGSRWLILGPSGCGKTTLLHVLAGLIPVVSGEVQVDGRDLGSLKGKDLDRWRGANVGIVLQALHLVPHLSVRDNLRLAQYLARAPQSDAAVGDALAALGVADKAARRPHELSQGEQQRVAIARAVVNGPKLLLADEPTASLDDAAAGRAVELLFSAAERRGATLVVATHDSRVKQHFSNTLQL